MYNVETFSRSRRLGPTTALRFVVFFRPSVSFRARQAKYVGLVWLGARRRHNERQRWPNGRQNVRIYPRHLPKRTFARKYARRSNAHECHCQGGCLVARCSQSRRASRAAELAEEPLFLLATPVQHLDGSERTNARTRPRISSSLSAVERALCTRRERKNSASNQTKRKRTAAGFSLKTSQSQPRRRKTSAQQPQKDGPHQRGRVRKSA